MLKGQKETDLFASYLYRYAEKYGIISKTRSRLENVYDDLIDRGLYLIRRATDVKYNYSTGIERLIERIDPMREFCFIFCLVSIDVFAVPTKTCTLINKAVILDALKDGKALKKILKIIDNCKPKKSALLWECGTLHYKTCNYSVAIEYFYKFLGAYTTEHEDVSQNDSNILDAIYKIAYCYEFTEKDINKALYIFSKLFLKYDPKMYGEFLTDDLKDHINKFYETVERTSDPIFTDLLNKYILLANIPDDINDKNNTELLHGFAHFINEMIIFKEVIKQKNLMDANNIMYAAACRSNIFCTCLGTNFSENKDFDDAISLFEYMLEKNIFDIHKQLHLRLEVVFYLAHAYLFSGNLSDARKKLAEFKEYCETLKDKDGLAHWAIYEAYLTLFESHNYLDITDSTIRLIVNQLENNRPSFYTTINIWKQWRFIRGLYFALSALKICLTSEGFSDPNTSDNIIAHLEICLRQAKLLPSLKSYKISNNGLTYYCIEDTENTDSAKNKWGGRIYYMGSLENVDLSFTEYVGEKNGDSDYAFGAMKDTVVTPFFVINSSDSEQIKQAIAIVNAKKDSRWYLTQAVSDVYTHAITADNIAVVSDTTPTNLLKYVYIELLFEIAVNKLKKPLLFLGLAPTKMTQLYKFNIRKIDGLHPLDNSTQHSSTAFLSNRIKSAIQGVKASTDKETKEIQRGRDIFDCLKKSLVDHDLNEKVLAQFFIPDNKNTKPWLYVLSQRVFSSKFPFSSKDGKEIRDGNSLFNAFSNKISVRLPATEHRSILYNELRQLAQGAKTNCQKCDWGDASIDCGHTVIRDIISDSAAKNFVKNLSAAITCFNIFNPNTSPMKSMLIVKLNLNEYVLVLFSENIDDEEKLHAIGREINAIQHNPAVKQKRSVSSDLGIETAEKRSTGIKKQSTFSTRPYRVALSYAEEQYESFVKLVSQKLVTHYGAKKVFDIHYPEHHVKCTAIEAKPILRQIYKEETDVIVVFSCKAYNNKNWSKTEWDALKDNLSVLSHRIRIFTFDKCVPSGIDLNQNGVYIIPNRSEQEIENVTQHITMLIEQLVKEGKI